MTEIHAWARRWSYAGHRHPAHARREGPADAGTRIPVGSKTARGTFNTASRFGIVGVPFDVNLPKQAVAVQQNQDLGWLVVAFLAALHVAGDPGGQRLDLFAQRPISTKWRAHTAHRVFQPRQRRAQTHVFGPQF